MANWRRTLRTLPGEFTFEDLDSIDSEIGRRAMEVFYDSFPLEEREPDEVLRAEREHPAETDREHHFRVLLTHEGEVVGISVFTTIDATYMGFLRYIAVSAAYRNRGIGRWLLADVLRTVWNDGKRRNGYANVGIAFEVERPDDAPDASSQSLRDRRIQWYKRNGASLRGRIDLLTPPLNEESGEMRYHVMFCTAVPKIFRGRWARRAIVSSVLEYGYEIPADSSYVRRALGID